VPDGERPVDQCATLHYRRPAHERYGEFDMEYDHSDKIGNEGDVVKHAVLCGLVEVLLGKNPGTSFGYAESHTGRSVYALPEKGRWLHGIKPFSENLLELDGRSAKGSSSRRFESLNAYRQACFPQKAQVGNRYFGSSGMVRQMLTGANMPFKFRLWDSNPSVVKSLTEVYGNDPNITVFEGDGYQGLQSLERASLALIDPISVKDDKASILNTMSHLAERGIPFLCWVPLFGEDEPIFNQFEREAKETHATMRVTWQVREGSTWGCQVTVINPYGDILEETCREVCEVMNAKPWAVHASSKEQGTR
jgi:23S rRNA A2030 N6-methylase RlmJ